jgi:hypothetical protein
VRVLNFSDSNAWKIAHLYPIVLAIHSLPHEFFRLAFICLPRTRHGVWLERGISFHPRGKAMPRILPTFAAIAIVGVCIAFNTMRYPIVWEMVGPNAQASLSEKNAPAAEASSSAKAASSSSAAQNAPPASNLPADPDPPSLAKDSTTPACPKAIPISLPKEEHAAGDAKQASEKVEKPENHIAPAADEKLVEPPRRLVPVARDAFSAGASGAQPDEIRRLPPVEAEVAFPADRYASEYPRGAIPIYPSTGK